MVSRMSGRRLLSAIVLIAVGIAIGVALRPAGGTARTAAQDPIQAFLGAVRRPLSGQFATPQAAVKFLVEQVRTQNYVEAMRVMPISEVYQHATFPLQVSYLQAVDLNSFFPKQPVSKFQYAAMRTLFSAYTQFDVLMLLPKLISGGAVAVPNAAKLKELEAQMDTKRLSRMRVRSMEPPQLLTGSRLGKGDGSGVTSKGVLDALISGVGADRALEFFVEKIGANWFVTGVVSTS
jgi:hypothetical protein